mgnify:CR=1 FL=1|tara:strand:- start:762 stop:1217 length:456 start_codon:yes stop_codon:yes gene_type:complete
MTKDEKWMKVAINEAKLAMKKNEIPVGAILVQNEKLIASAHNEPIKKNDPTAHAEIQVLRKAGKIMKNYRFPNSTLYATLEPCTMCFGAMIHARIDRIVFGASDSKTGVCGSTIDLIHQKFYNHSIDIHGGILENECKELLSSFFKELRRR